MDSFLPYQNIIGFTSTDCECEQEDRPADYNESKSGIFLEELSPVALAMGLASCDKSFWDILTVARDGAIKEFVSNTNALLAGKYRAKRAPISGQVFGEIKAKDLYDNELMNYAVTRISCAPIRGGYMRLNAVGGIFQAAGLVSVSLYNNVDGLLQSFDITTLANRHSTTSLNLELPMFSKYVNRLEYQLVYTYQSGNLPKDNKLKCGCGGWDPDFNTDTPYNSFAERKAVPWANYVMVGGNNINSLSELEELPIRADNDMRGLTIDVDFFCKSSELVSNMDFIGNPLALSAAIAIKYLTGVNVANAILKSPLLERENMVAQEDWEISAEEWQIKYNEQTNYIADNVNLTANDCLACKDLIEMTNQGIFS